MSDRINKDIGVTKSDAGVMTTELGIMSHELETNFKLISDLEDFIQTLTGDDAICFNFDTEEEPQKYHGLLGILNEQQHQIKHNNKVLSELINSFKRLI